MRVLAMPLWLKPKSSRKSGVRAVLSVEKYGLTEDCTETEDMDRLDGKVLIDTYSKRSMSLLGKVSPTSFERVIAH